MRKIGSYCSFFHPFFGVKKIRTNDHFGFPGASGFGTIVEVIVLEHTWKIKC